MTARYSTILLFLCSMLLLGCGSSSAFNPVNPPVVSAATPTPTPSPTPSPTPTPVPTPTPPPIPPAQPLTCSGDVLTGQLCDQSDGVHFYRHDQFILSVRADGHGTFGVIEEAGFYQNTGLTQIVFPFPQAINILEIHGTLQINSWCNNNGVVTKWDSLSSSGNSEIVGGKDFNFNAGETQSFVIPQVLFPAALPSSGLRLNVFTDLCGSSTVHWLFNGSF